jgi:predicted glycosyltransferase
MLGEERHRGSRRPDRSPQATRFLFYSHDGLGLGHVRRSLCIARAVTELRPEASVLVATSADEAEQFGIPRGVDLLKLPGLRKIDNGHYAPRRLQIGFDEVASLRAHLLAVAVESFRPAVVLADKHPFGVGGELLPALEIAREIGARAVLGMRDVLDDPAVVRSEWDLRNFYERIPSYYDRVLVYGQPDVFDPRRAYHFPEEVVGLTRFCGYVVSTRRNGNGPYELGIPPSPSGRPVVLATAGGGEDGFALLSAFIEASAAGSWQAIAVTGPQCPPERVQRLRALATLAGVGFHRFVANVSDGFPSLDALVAMGGYNTLAEAVASGVPTICVPRVRPRREQLIRAQAFAHFGLLQLLEPHLLDAGVLRAEIEAALAGRRDPGRNGSVLALGGARRAALELCELAGEERVTPRRSGSVAAG